MDILSKIEKFTSNHDYLFPIVLSEHEQINTSFGTIISLRDDSVSTEEFVESYDEIQNDTLEEIFEVFFEVFEEKLVEFEKTYKRCQS